MDCTLWQLSAIAIGTWPCDAANYKPIGIESKMYTVHASIDLARRWFIHLANV